MTHPLLSNQHALEGGREALEVLGVPVPPTDIAVIKTLLAMGYEWVDDDFVILEFCENGAWVLQRGGLVYNNDNNS